MVYLSFKMQQFFFISVFAIICQTVFTVGFERTWISRQQRMTNEEECNRPMPEPGKNTPLCCQLPNILPGLDNEWEKCFEIFKQFKDKPETKEYKEMSRGKNPPCFFNCIFKNSGLYTYDGKLNKDAITKKMNEGMNNNDKWKSLWQPALNKCFDEVEHEDENTNPMIINHPAGRLMKCFLRDIYVSCPKDAWTESQECTNLKNLVQKCPDMPPPVFKPPPKMI